MPLLTPDPTFYPSPTMAAELVVTGIVVLLT